MIAAKYCTPNLTIYFSLIIPVDMINNERMDYTLITWQNDMEVSKVDCAIQKYLPNLVSSGISKLYLNQAAYRICYTPKKIMVHSISAKPKELKISTIEAQV